MCLTRSAPARPRGVAGLFGFQKKHISSRTLLPLDLAAKYPIAYPYAGLQWGSDHRLRPGAFLAPPDKDVLWQVDGVYALLELETKLLHPYVAFLEWRPVPVDDKVDPTLGLPLYHREALKLHITLAELTNRVRPAPTLLHPPHLSLQNPSWVHTLPDYAGHPQCGEGLNYVRKNSWLRRPLPLRSIEPRPVRSEVVPNASA